MKKQKKTIKEDVRGFIEYERSVGFRNWVIYLSLPFYLLGRSFSMLLSKDGDFNIFIQKV